MPEETKGQSEFGQVRLMFTRSVDLKLYFTNSVQLSPGNPNEVQIFFGQIVAPPSGSKPESLEVRQDVGVTMTMFEFKRLFRLMEQQIPIIEGLFEHVETGS